MQLFKEQKPVFRKRFLLPKYNGYKTIAVEEIDHIFWKTKSPIWLRKTERKKLSSRQMEDLEDELNPEDFFRANRQFFVHVNSIAVIQNSYNGK